MSEKVAPLTHNYLPEHLKRKQLYFEVCELIDYLIKKCYEPHIINMRDKLNPNGTGFDPDEFLHLIDGFKYKDSILNGVDIRTAAHLLPRIYTLKGTKKGLQMLLNILGIKADIYIWWELIRKLGVDQNYTIEFRNRFGNIETQDIENCSIYLNLIDQAQTMLDADIDIKLRELCSTFLWVCANINVINIARQFLARIDVRDVFTFNQKYVAQETIYDSYFYRYGHIGTASNVIYNSVHKYGETDLVYSSGTADSSDVTGYIYLPELKRFTSVGSILNAEEKFHFSSAVEGITSRLLDENIDVHHYIVDRITSTDNLQMTGTQEGITTNIAVRDSLQQTYSGSVIDGIIDERTLYNHPNIPINTYGQDGLLYQKPISDRVTLNSNLNYLIEED